MRVRIISFGTNWWTMYSRDSGDPYCFRRRAAWFNSAGIRCGHRLRLCWVCPGQIRFNQTSGFQPEFPFRSVGRVFLGVGPNRLHGRMHLLFSRLLIDSASDCCLVTVNDVVHGRISFASPSWKSDGVRPISVSMRRRRYEAMLLMRAEDWIETEVGKWSVSPDNLRLVLRDGGNV